MNVEITTEKLDHDQLLASVFDPNAGANLLFLGTTRQWTGQEETHQLHYECYEAMALKQLQALVDEAKEKWPLKGCRVAHRVGNVGIGEASLAVAVSSPHRVEAFEAAQWLIDKLKEVVPVWKQEVRDGGITHWVHPGTDTCEITSPVDQSIEPASENEKR